MLPSLNLINSTKFVSFVSVTSFFEREVFICNLSAPGAAKFENPLALSYNPSSSFAVINCSSIVKPTR